MPTHIVLEKVLRWIPPDGLLFLTTPNLYRLRNSIPLLIGMPVFFVFRYPVAGCSIGHPLEYSKEHLKWHLREAGFERIETKLMQMSNRGFTPQAVVARLMMAPLYIRPIWRDGLVASARKASK